jgi:hypothetical protein
MSFNVTSNFMASNGVKRPQREDFKVLLKGARGLRAADFSFVGKGKSDPFCRAQILGRPHSKVDSPHIKKTLDPDWNYECHFDGVKDSDHLQFEVYDYDMIGSPDLLGKVDLPFARFVDGMDEEVALEETDGNQSTLLLSIEKIPKDAEQEADVRCFVTIKAAHNLRSADWGGRSDPYCTCEIINKPKSKFQTKVLFKTLEPVWDEEDELEDYDEDDDIRFEVWDYDLVGANDSLGWVIVKNSQFHPLGFSGPLYLEDAGKSTGAHLEVQIDVDAPPPPIEPIDPLEHVTIAETQRVPFKLRSLETNRTHPLRGFTSIGRSRTLLDPERDLIIDARTSPDVGRAHGHIKACLLPDYATWLLRVYDKPRRERITLQSVSGKYVVSQADGRLLTTTSSCATAVFEVERRSTEKQMVMLKNAHGQYLVAGPDGQRLYAIGEGEGLEFIMNTHHPDQVSMQLADQKTTYIITTELGEIVLYTSSKGQPKRARFVRAEVTGGLGVAEGGGHAGSGTSVDGRPVDKWIGAPIQPGSCIRFGKNELWLLECAALYGKSERAAAAESRALVLEEDDPAAMRELQIPTIACHDAIQSCRDWISIVRVVLEWLNEPDEPPCVDCIEVTDELRRTASVHTVNVFEEQQAYDVRKILDDVRLGTTLKLRLCSDPYLLAPVLSYLEELNNWLADQYESHKH